MFGVYLEVYPTDDETKTPLLFRILLNSFQAAMLAVLVINMVQAVEPMAVSQIKPKDRLKPWARKYLDDNVFDTKWYLTLMVGVLWSGIIAIVVTHLSYDSKNLDWTIAIICLVVLGLSLASVNPGMALMGLWGLLWLIPVGLAFVCRSAFDTSLLLINKANLAKRRMANEVVAHARTSAIGRFSVRDMLILMMQVLPLTPLFLVSLPIPLLDFFVRFIHLSMRALLCVADVMVLPLSHFRLHPILSDYGSVAWKMARLSMDVEGSSMRALLRARVERLMSGSLGERYDSGVLPCKPYWHLSKCSDTRLGCISIAMGDRKEVSSKALVVSQSYVSNKAANTADETAEVC